MGKGFGYTGKVVSEHPIQLDLRYSNWPPIFSDHWFLPRFNLTITNLGKTIGRGNLDVYIFEFDKAGPIGSIGNYEGPFQDVFHREITNLQVGKKLKINFVVGSSFLKEGRYIIRVVLSESDISLPPLIELERHLSDLFIPDNLKQLIRENTLHTYQQMGIDPLRMSAEQFYKNVQLLDIRFLEVVKVYSLEKASAILGAFIGSMIGTAIMVVLGIIALLGENWSTLKNILGL